MTPSTDQKAVLVDLFCGGGGLSLGAHEAGFTVGLAIDNDSDLTASFSRNFPNTRLVSGDLSDPSALAIPTLLDGARPLGVIGGPPCQGFSMIGRRDKDDPRNDLLGSFFAVVAQLRPSFFVMENVPALSALKNLPKLESALSCVPDSYVILPPVTLDAADFGAATNRPRLLVIGYDPARVSAMTIEDFQAAKSSHQATVRDAISDLPEPVVGSEWAAYDREPASPYAQALRVSAPEGLGSENHRDAQKVSGCEATVHTAEVAARFDKLPPGDRDPVSRYPRLRWDRPAAVLRAGTGADRGSYQAARPIHPSEPRVVTVREAARIQGFPDWFQFHRTKWHSHRIIGNSVSPVFAEAIFKLIAEKTE